MKMIYFGCRTLSKFDYIVRFSVLFNIEYGIIGRISCDYRELESSFIDTF